MSKNKGNLFLIPNTLGGDSFSEIIPQGIINKVTDIRIFAVEEIKSARRLLRKMDRSFPIDDCTFLNLSKQTSAAERMELLMHLLDGKDVGIISEAGCPGIADPGAELVSLAHSHALKVIPLVGPSSIFMALMASGFSGQKFTFHGYLSKERKDRIKQLRDFEIDCRRSGFTHVFMDTPFRNMNVLEDILNELGEQTYLCIASNITLPSELVQTKTILEWREYAYELHKIPVIFIIGKPQ